MDVWQSQDDLLEKHIFGEIGAAAILVDHFVHVAQQMIHDQTVGSS